MYHKQTLDNIGEYMVSNGHTLCVAESVTSGHLQAAFSLTTDATKFFLGGITAYNLAQKIRHLQVDPVHATACNSVSETVAEEMAINALSLFGSDWSVGITGYASPIPEMGIRKLFALHAIAFHGQIVHRARVESADGSPLDAQVHFANQVITQFREVLKGSDF